MTFAAPLALLWALAMAPIIALYVLKVRQRRMVVPTTMFWRQVFEDKRPRTLWQQLRHLLSLLMQLLIVALMVLALAQPLLGWQMLEPRKIVLIVDTSASMSATDVAPSRLAEARRRAGDIIDGLRYFDTMAVIAAASQPRVACGMTGHQRTLHAAVNAVEPTDAPTDLSPAVELARRLLAGDEQGLIILITDGGFNEAPEFATAPDIDVIRVGDRAADNLAITQFQVRRSLINPLGYEALIEVSNFSDKPAETRLEIYLGESVVDVFPLAIEPSGRWMQTLDKTSAAGGVLKAALAVDDALAVDNAAHAVLPERKRQDVVLVTKGNLFLQRVFEAMPLVNLRVVDEAPPPETPPDALMVFHRQVPSELPSGPVLVIDPESSTDLWQASGPLDSPLVAQQDATSPLMAHVRLDNVYMPEARKLKPADGAMVLAAAITGDPIYFGFDSPPQRPGSRMLVLTANLDRGDLPLRTAFPIMVANALAWFSGGGGEVSESVSTGETAQLTLASHAAQTVTITSPAGLVSNIPGAATGDQITIGPLTTAGVWRAQRGPEQVRVAANLCNRRESDLSTSLPVETADATAAHASFTGKPTWFYLLAAAVALAALEWFLYQRRWIS